MNDIKTPYYLIDLSKIKGVMGKVQQLKNLSSIKCLLALKAFSTWPVFPWLKDTLDGTTSSSLFELKLGKELFGKEAHAYSVAYSEEEMKEVGRYGDKVIFNSISQLKAYAHYVESRPIGLRVNPLIGFSPYDISNPVLPESRLGEHDIKEIKSIVPMLSGVMIHNHCDTTDFKQFNTALEEIESRFSWLFDQLSWVSLGGGVLFTHPDFPLEQFAKRLKDFSEKHQIQVYLEPGTALVHGCGSLVTTVLDVIKGAPPKLIVDASIEAHLLDQLIYRLDATVEPNEGPYTYQVCGRSCLAGDIFGVLHFPKQLKVGSQIEFTYAAAYSLVKKNWFNGLNNPSIVLKHLDGHYECIKSFNYQDFLNSHG